MSFVHKSKKAAYTAARKAVAQGEYQMSDVEIVSVPGGYEIKVMSDPIAEATFERVAQMDEAADENPPANSSNACAEQIEPLPEIEGAEEPEDLTDEQRAAVQAAEEQLACATDPRQDAIPLRDTPAEPPAEPAEGRFPPIRFPDMEPEAEPTPPGDEPEPAPQDPCAPEPEAPPQIESTGTLADFARAENARRGIVPLGSTGRTFILCVEQGFPQTSPEAWALEISRKAGMPVTIRDAVTFELLSTRDAKAEMAAKAKSERAPRAARPEGEPAGANDRGITQRLVAALDHPEGRTRKELQAISGSAQPPSQRTLRKVCAKARRELDEIQRDGKRLYRFQPVQRLTHEAA